MCVWGKQIKYSGSWDADKGGVGEGRKKVRVPPV